LDFRSWRSVLQNQRNVLSLDAWNAYVTGEWLSGDDDRHCLHEPQDQEKLFGAIDILHDNCEVIEVLQHLPSFRLDLQIGDYGGSDTSGEALRWRGLWRKTHG
jgi:hypothetical protein